MKKSKYQQQGFGVVTKDNDQLPVRRIRSEST